MSLPAASRPPRTRWRQHLGAALLSGLCLLSSPAGAQSNGLNGQWTASSLRVSWAIGDWGEACGPRPSGGGERGGTVTLSQTGSGFRLSGLGREYTSGQCWERMPGLTTKSKSAGSSAIVARCSMPAGDPRQASVVTTWYPRGDEIYFDETGQYQFVVSGSNCTASVRRTRVLTRVIVPETVKAPPTGEAKQENPPEKLEKKPETALPPAPARASQCERPGPATQVEVSPTSKLMRQGESFTFQVIARDSSGCRVPAPARWELVKGQGASLNRHGVLKVADDAPTGHLKLRMSAFDKEVFVSARVVSEAEYEKLLAGGSYGVLGESLKTTAIAVTSSHVELDEVPTAEERGDKRILLALVAAALLLLCGVALWLLKVRSRTEVRTKTAPLPEALEQERRDSSSAASEAPEPEQAPARPARLCPVCGKRYEDATQFCVDDGARLMRSN